MIGGGNPSLGPANSVDSFSSFVKKAYMMIIVSILLAIYEWHFIRAYFRYDISKYATVFMLLGFILVTLFHAIPKIRYGYPTNYFFMIVTQELMIMATGSMFAQASFEYLILHTLFSLFIFICLMIIGATLQRNFSVDPFYFLTIIFINFMIVIILIYFHLTLGNSNSIILINFIIMYSLAAVLIYHSMVLHCEESDLHDEDFMLMGLLLFVDYICLFTFGILLLPKLVKKARNYCFCVGDTMNKEPQEMKVLIPEDW